MSDQLSNEELDRFLDLILPCDSKIEYERALAKFAVDRGRSAQIGIDEGDQLLRRRSNRRTDYTGPHSDRRLRANLPFTWVEKRILNWALQKDNSESKAEVTVSYIANLLKRTMQEITDQIDKVHVLDEDIKGFDL